MSQIRKSYKIMSSEKKQDARHWVYFASICVIRVSVVVCICRCTEFFWKSLQETGDKFALGT